MAWLRFRKKLSFLILLLVLFTLCLSHFICFSDLKEVVAESGIVGFDQTDRETRNRLHYPNYKFSFTDAFEENIDGWGTFASKPKNERCLAFFEFLDKNQPDWKVESFKERHFDKNIVKKEKMISSELKHVLKSKTRKKLPPDITDSDRERVHETFDRKFRESTHLEQDMADTMTIVRIFGHCFFDQDSAPLRNELADIYHRYSNKVISFISPELPEASTGSSVESLSRVFDTKIPIEKDNLLDHYFKNMQGTGIVLSIGSQHITELIKFIHVLRALGNTLPIEVVYRSDLLPKSGHAIYNAASVPKEALLHEILTNQLYLNRALEKVGIEASEVFGLSFPPQKVTLIDISKPLSKLSGNDFANYDNKLLAMLFNSFERVFLFDTDAIPLLPLEQLQTIKEFSETGAYFFRDRTLMDKNDWIETNFFAKLMPHLTNQIDMAMGVKPVTSHTMGNTYMNGWRHCQEAGLVMFDRKRHFRSLLTLLPLSLWDEPISSLIWGDKEMYWLAMSIAGDEEYSFNKYGASSVGELTPEDYLKHYNNSIALELCSSHPGHVSLDGQLLWINSGFSYCKKNKYGKDKMKFPFSAFQVKSDAKNLFEYPLKILHALLPPELPLLRGLDGSPDLSRERKYSVEIQKRKKDVDELPGVDQIDTYNPQKGWIKSQVCGSYQYCAYNAIQAFDGSGILDDSGAVFEFDANSVRRYGILGAVWGSALPVKEPLKLGTDSEAESESSRRKSKTMATEMLSSSASSSEMNFLSSDFFLFLKGWKNDNTIPSLGGKNVDYLAQTSLSDLSVESNKGGNKNNIEDDKIFDPKYDIDYDPSTIRERPEKLRNDVNDALAKLGVTKKHLT